MNFIKSLFIFILPVWLIYILSQGILSFFNDHPLVQSIGILLSALPLVIFLSYLLLFRNLARTSEHLLIVSTLSFIGYVMVMVIFYQERSFISMISMIYALSAFLMTFLYIYWYSNNKRKKSQSITNGNLLPEFIIQDTKKTQVSSKVWQGKKAIIFFYRGNWCPLCMAQIDEIAASYKKFAKMNVNVIFIAPQSSKNTQKLANRFNLDFKFYTDINNHSAKKLGISHANGLPMGFQLLGYASDSVYPTIIAIDESGIIIYNDQTDNYRVRPEPEDLLKVFD
jgi:peroxiredoxin